MDDDNLVKYKEFAQFFFLANPSLKYGYESKYLQLMRHQQFNKIYFDPSLGRTRLLINHSTGSGKTKTTIMIAEEYIRHYKNLPSAPQVFILNYNRDVYIDTLLKTPDFGYVSEEEIANIDKLHKKYISTQLDEDYNLWRNTYLQVRNRITNRQVGGYYKFHGYLDFANKLGYNLDPPQINQLFLDTLKNSLIIADEFQNIYNSDELNVAGEALKYVLDYFDKNIYFVGCSWTPISNSPTEILDIMRIFTGKIVNKNLIFTGNNELKPGAVDIIKRELKGCISYYYSLSTENYPPFEFIGEDIPDITFENISNTYKFKFIRCQPQGEYLRVLTEYGIKSDDMHITDHVLRDMVLPGGIYNTHEVKVSIEQINEAINDLPNYSAKYARLVEDLPKMKGKIIIFHDFVKSSGILFIERIMRRKLGYIPEGREPLEITPCYECGIMMSKHTDKSHEYRPVKYNMIHSDLDDLILKNNFRNFNAPNNNMGQEIKIQLGSHKIITSYDYKQVSNLVIVSFPNDFSSLTQLIGRVIRTGAGAGMPPDWKVKIHIYVTANSLEENIYKRKYKVHIPITQINDAIREIAVDNNINRNLTDKELTPKEEKFLGYNLYRTESTIIERLIEAAFLEAPQYTYDDLWAWVQNPPIKVDINTKIISENIFIYVLTELIEEKQTFAQYGPYYMRTINLPSEIISQEIDINTIDIDNLLAINNNKNITRELFKNYSPSIHIAVIRRLIVEPNKNRNLFNFYKTHKIIENNNTYIDPSFKSIHIYNKNTHDFNEEYYENPPEINDIFGFYEDGQMKIIQMDQRKKSHEDQRRMHRGIACKSIKVRELEKIMKSLNATVEEKYINTFCDQIEEILITRHLNSKSKIFFSFLGKGVVNPS